MDKNFNLIKAPIASLGRHRLLVDGQGITTLICFQGCPLRCKMCPNPYAISNENKNAIYVTPQKLYEKVKIDELYFLASGGGVTFGGGEPLLYPEFIQEFRNICGNSWHLCVETSLFVPWDNINAVVDVVDLFYFDCKDINSAIYKKYTGKENELVLDNIVKLARIVPSDKIIVRIPLIHGFNTEDQQKKSVKFVSDLGLDNFDLFTYNEYLNP